MLHELEYGEMPSRMMIEARERIAIGWCQGTVAQAEDGRTVAPESSDARRWSLLGALLASWNGGPVGDLRQAVTSLNAATGRLPLEVWNDQPGRTQTDVVNAFEQAIDALASGGEKATPAGAESAYWLCTCEGFRVDSENGRVGVVEEVRLSPSKKPQALAVRTGLFRTRLEIVPVSDVERIIPRKKRVLLRAATS